MFQALLFWLNWMRSIRNLSEPQYTLFDQKVKDAMLESKGKLIHAGK